MNSLFFKDPPVIFGYVAFMKKILTYFLMVGVFLVNLACSQSKSGTTDAVSKATLTSDVQKFIDDYTETYQKLYYKSSLAQWLANTDVTDEHDKAVIAANEEYSKFVGGLDVINKTRDFLKVKDRLPDLQQRQLRNIWLNAAQYPGIIPDKVKETIAAETKQTSDLYSFEFKVKKDGRDTVVTANEMNKTLLKSQDLNERLAVWNASKEVGKGLRPGLTNLVNLHNQMAQAMGYSSYFALQTANYDMTPKQMVDLMDQVLEELKPLYTELHTYARYELAERYNQPVPDQLPAHWIGNRWGQEWPGLVEGIDLDNLFKDKTPEWIMQQAEGFYVGLGFPKLNKTFWEKSDLYPATKESGRKKNNHASAWHLDLDQDYRSLMSVEPNMDWFGTTHHELGHIYYYIAYSNPSVPILLREGANRAFHEGLGTLIQLASGQRPYMESVGLLTQDTKIDNIQWLLNQALEFVVFMPFGAGTMTHFEYDLYEKNLDPKTYNKVWWDYVKKFQGIAPPTERGEEYTDAATKTHINDDPAQYYDYAVSSLILFQLHNHIAKNILHQDPTSCNYKDNKAVGDFLRNILSTGSTKNWQQVMKETTGETLNAKAITEYFAPLMDYLQKANAGRRKTVL